jgi:hypothetical protein
MRAPFRICGLVLGLLGSSSPIAQAAVTRLAISGTTANLNLAVSTPGARPDCTVDAWVVLMASASVQRSDNTSSAGAVGFVQRADNCTGDLEFGSFNVSLPWTAFDAGSGTAALDAAIPVVMESFGPAGGTVTRSLVAALRFTSLEDNSVASRSSGRFRAPGVMLMTKSRSLFNAAGVTGQLSLDGTPLVTPQASIEAGIETAGSTTVEITR